MAFDQSTRNRLARFVGDVRNLLTDEFTRQLQNEYGLDPESGTVTGLEKLTAQDDTKRETARILRETMDYYLAGKTDDKKNRQDVLQRIVREQAFTVLNRLCALRMAESRGILIESIAKGYQSKGFQLYARLAGNGLGETGDAYSSYLFSLFDEFAVDLAVLFDRFNPQGRLFPRQTTLVKLLDLINDLEIEQLWAEDETIGWMYQYFNTKEERKEMRDASQAPRNSRELAVRNQFFTPRYVVEFLTDNTLGRIWYEMTKGETSLKDSCHYLVRRQTEIFLKDGEVAPAQESDESLSQEELLKQPVYIPHRPLKDPREIKMLDPACGSMHFGLYAFDLFEQIYAEAWDLEETQGDAHMRLGDLESLHTTYQTREAYLRDVPRLIIERNIHGVDIDPRAVQIAGLSLWLRAQKSWHAQGVKPQDRPQIRRSNIVCAEPMPGDRALLEEFLQTFKEDRLEALMRRVLNVSDGQKIRATKAMAEALANLVRTVWQEMELAGEAGSLLKIEVTLRDAIEKASSDSKEKAPLFSVLEFGTDNSSQPASLGMDGNFWSWAETLVLEALQEYAEQSEYDGSYQKRLFAGDAAQGFAFIDICRNQYDIVLMNPPFGSLVASIKPYAMKEYPSKWTDIYAVFIYRSIGMLRLNRGFLGCITSSTFLNLSTFEQFRHSLITDNQIITIADFGNGVMDDAAVSAAGSIIGTHNRTSQILFVDCKKEREVTLKALPVSLKNGRLDSGSHIITTEIINNLPQSIFAYWLSKNLISLMSKLPRLENFAHCTFGLHSHGMDEQLFRTWWEVNQTSRMRENWPVVKLGGDPEHFYKNSYYVVNWENNALVLHAHAETISGGTFIGHDNYFMKGLSYIYTAQTTYSIQVLEQGSIFTAAAHGLFPKDNDDLLFFIGFLNSEAVRLLLKVINPNRFFQSAYVKSLPIPDYSAIKVKVSEYAHFAIQECKKHLVGDECGRIFIRDWATEARSLGKETKNLAQDRADVLQDLKEKINSVVCEVYGIDSTDLQLLSKRIGPSTAKPLPGDQDILSSSGSVIAQSHFSYLVGLIFGRWDIRVAIGEKTISANFDPFAAPPISSPGMLQNGEGMPASQQKELLGEYPIPITWSGILVDDESQREDIGARLQDVLRIIWREKFESIEQEACQLLNMRSLREYYRKPSGFFADHLKRYTKGHHQSPIYWLLSTPSSSYTLWLYYHRLNDQTLFTCVNDFVDPKIKQVSEEVKNLRQKKSRSSAEEKELERLTDFEHELKDFRDELLRVAKFWRPNLNDGVQITAAPLWKLFQHKPWQKKLRETWESLEAGEYDWAHLAYSIWSERVREKCKSDKSLAIAHDLEHLYVETKIPLKKKAASKKKSKAETEELFNED